MSDTPEFGSIEIPFSSTSFPPGTPTHSPTTPSWACAVCDGGGWVLLNPMQMGRAITDIVHPMEPCSVSHPVTIDGVAADPDKVVWMCVRQDNLLSVEPLLSHSLGEAHNDQCGHYALTKLSLSPPSLPPISSRRLGGRRRRRSQCMTRQCCRLASFVPPRGWLGLTRLGARASQKGRPHHLVPPVVRRSGSSVAAWRRILVSLSVFGSWYHWPSRSLHLAGSCKRTIDTLQGV